LNITKIQRKSKFVGIFPLIFEVPPTIDDAMSNSDVIVREGSDLSFTCHARGSPTPTVKWRREDGRKISFNKTYSGKFNLILIKIFEEY
jgi:Immunoglobulin domain